MSGSSLCAIAGEYPGGVLSENRGYAHARIVPKVAVTEFGVVSFADKVQLTCQIGFNLLQAAPMTIAHHSSAMMKATHNCLD